MDKNKDTYTNEIFVKDYFKIHNFYANIYGKDKTIILMQVGSFHEAYCTNDKGLELLVLAQKLDVVCTKKNGSKELGDSNPRMMGFPIHVTRNFIEKLINLNYTVVLIDQTSEPPNPKREITGIYSPATWLEKNNTKVANLVSIVIDKTKTKLDDQLYIGIASYDLATGKGYFYETYSTPSDQLLALDDTIRFLETVPPREVLLINKLTSPIANMEPEEILQYLQIDNYLNIKLENQEKIKYQERILESVFPSENQLNVFENLDLTVHNHSRLALVVLLEYCKAHQTNLLNNIKKPSNFTNDKCLYYGNRAMEQLDVFSKEKGLYNIINNTKTTLGQRFLNEALTKPLIESIELQKRYDSISKIIESNYNSNLENFLEDIYDIERLHRRIDMSNLHPYELNHLYLSFYQIDKLLNFLTNKKLDILHNNDTMNKNIKTFTTFIDKKFVLGELSNTNFSNYFDDNKTFFKKGLIKEIDDLVSKIDTGSDFINILKLELEKLINDEKNLLGKSDNSLITSKYNERDGHYMFITNRRCKVLKEKLKNKTELNIGAYKLKVSDLEFIELPRSSNTKINCTKIKEISNEITLNKQKLATLNKFYFKETLVELSSNFRNLFIYWGREIGYLDFINSGATTSIKNKYIKPMIKENIDKKSYFKSSKLRHPIVEVISKEFNYVPHDISLGGDSELDGILLYGINSSGKSTLMKSIGLNIILAQIGYFVAAEKFVYYPYKTLFTRIIGNDNIFKGLSSFMVEMMELTSILKRNNNSTLVIGDEICRGTEEKSANIIVSYMLETLSKSNSSFITATHLHKVANMECVKKLDRVKAKHLKITYDPENEQLIYDRSLSDGQGDTFYGLTVAKYLMKDSLFTKRTGEILKEYDELESPKKSNYNDDFMLECHICKSKKNLESHHIIPQKDFLKDKINFIQKDNYSNLVTLCELCHDKIDTNELVINGWLNTTNGRKLDFTLQEKVKNNKHSIEMVDYIKKLKELKDPKMAIIKIKEKFDKKVSTLTIQKYWKTIEI